MSIFEEMKRRKLCRNTSDFATDWLGKSHSYFRVRKELSAEAKLTLWRKLKETEHQDLAAMVLKEILD